jgi:hypothetical protein
MHTLLVILDVTHSRKHIFSRPLSLCREGSHSLHAIERTDRATLSLTGLHCDCGCQSRSIECSEEWFAENKDHKPSCHYHSVKVWPICRSHYSDSCVRCTCLWGTRDSISCSMPNASLSGSRIAGVSCNSITITQSQ